MKSTTSVTTKFVFAAGLVHISVENAFAASSNNETNIMISTQTCSGAQCQTQTQSEDNNVGQELPSVTMDTGSS